MWIDQLLKLNLDKNNHFKDELELVHSGECNWWGRVVNSQHTLKRIKLCSSDGICSSDRETYMQTY